MSDIECSELLDQLNEEFAEALSLVLINRDDVKKWGGSSNLKFTELTDAYGPPEKLGIYLREMPIWYFTQRGLDLYVVDLAHAGVDQLILMFNAHEAKSERLLELP